MLPHPDQLGRWRRGWRRHRQRHETPINVDVLIIVASQLAEGQRRPPRRRLHLEQIGFLERVARRRWRRRHPQRRQRRSPEGQRRVKLAGFIDAAPRRQRRLAVLVIRDERRDDVGRVRAPVASRASRTVDRFQTHPVVLHHGFIFRAASAGGVVVPLRRTGQYGVATLSARQRRLAAGATQLIGRCNHFPPIEMLPVRLFRVRAGFAADVIRFDGFLRLLPPEQPAPGELFLVAAGYFIHDGGCARSSRPPKIQKSVSLI